MRHETRRTAAAILLTASIVIALPAAAQQRVWRPSSSSGEQTAFIDTGSIQRNGDKVRFWREVRSRAPMTLETGDRFDRLGALMEVDCRARTLVNVEVYVRLGDTLIGEGPGDGTIEPIAAGSTAETDMRAVCLDEWPA